MASFALVFYAGRVMLCLWQTSLHRCHESDKLTDGCFLPGNPTLALAVPEYHLTSIAKH